ncbi:hypothetical protein CYY_003214 [Polysphondylium violaceum]|uniref:SCP domain-containing protein n=1 Tax=Polysphondylium violaceum TaxID=133409 RepID=A0A8J4V1H7_9MYCE|nr:hypothetical protein CYY_003214 [Polysphondylium violaceum]
MKSVFLLFTLLFVAAVYGYGEANSDGHPNWVERESHTLLNFVRINPSAYRQNFMPASRYKNVGNILLSGYKPTAPLYYNETFNKLALYHSDDMSKNKCFSHDSCDKTKIGERFAQFLGSCIPAWGENIAVGYSSGILQNNLLICEDGTTCISDGQSGVGHRNNIMSSSYVQVGVGFTNNYITQDFRASGCISDAPTSPIHAGSHTYNISGSQLTYITTFYNSQLTVNSAEIEFSNSRENLVLLYGTANQGAYIYQPTNGTQFSCEPYRFVFSTNNGTFTYPDTGSLITSNKDCTDTYTDHSPSSATTTTVSVALLCIMMIATLFF